MFPATFATIQDKAKRQPHHERRQEGRYRISVDRRRGRRDTMTVKAPMLMVASALVVGLLGAIHLLYTFRGNKLFPRDTHLERQMALVSPVLTRQTTMWKAWVGFNASHGLGAVFFSLVYGYLALRHADLLFGSTYLLALGFALLSGYLYLAWNYWFSVPLVGIGLSTVLYAWAVLVGRYL